MANPFYNYDGQVVVGTLARAEQIAVELTQVAAGFNGLTVQGVDSGVANAYVVTVTSGGPSAAYADGGIVEFKASASNTGACTINVNSVGVVSLTNFQGQSLAGGAIIAGTWYRIMYNSTFSCYTVIAPTSQVITSNTISPSAPTNKVGLTASGGVSTACVPIDATYALDVTIAPTWTGAHIFANSVTFNSTVSFAGGLTLTGNASQYAATLDGNAGTGVSFGLEVNAGTNSSDVALLVQNAAASTGFFKIDGAGNVTVGAPTGGGKGLGTINATGLFVNGVAVLTSSAAGANPTAKIGLATVNGAAATFMRSDGAPPLDVSISPTWTGNHIFTPTSGQAVNINVPVNQVGFVITGGTNTSNNYLAELISGQGSGFSSGLFIQAGTTSADNALLINNAANSLNYLSVYGDGQVMIGAPPAATKQTSTFFQVGYLDAPQDNHTTSFTLALINRGKSKYLTGSTAGQSATIPANSSVAFPVGTVVTIDNESTQSWAINITTDTLMWMPTKATGNRTLTAGGVCTLYKATATKWHIWGFGIT